MCLAHAGRIPIQIPVHEVSMAFIESLRLALNEPSVVTPLCRHHRGCAILSSAWQA
jgi:hypothetical protein